MRKTVKCPLLYLIVIHLVAVIAIVAIVAPWFGFRLSKVRVDEASAFLVAKGWWGDDWKEFVESTSWSYSGGFSLDPLRERYVRVNDAHGNLVVHLKFDAQGDLDSISLIPPGLMTVWWFGRSTSGWSIATWVTDNPEVNRSPNATFERFTQYRDMNATGMPDEMFIRTDPPTPGRSFRLKADAWEEYFREPAGTAAPIEPGTEDEESDTEPDQPSTNNPDHE